MNPKISITLILLTFFLSQLTIFSQYVSETNLEEEQEHFYRYALGFNYDLSIENYKSIEFDESNIDFSFDFGRFINPTIMIGVKLYHSYLHFSDESSETKGFRVSCIPIIRYYLIRGLFCESGVGLGYGFYSFHNDVNILLRDWEDIIIYRFLISTGYDIPINKNKSIIIRPSVYYMFKKDKIIKYPDSANNNKENEIGISVGFIIFI